MVKQFLEEPRSSSKAYALSWVSDLCVAVSTAFLCVSTMEVYASARPAAQMVELVFGIIFTLEFLVRTAVQPTVCKALEDPYFYIDFMSALLIWLDLYVVPSTPTGADFMLIISALRICRMFKITRYNEHTYVIKEAFMRSGAALLAPLLFLVVISLVMATVLYYFEILGARAQNRAFNWTEGSENYVEPAFNSIPHAIWFMFVTLTTVGYGDVSPVTHLGQATNCGVMMFGVFFMAMPLAIVGNNFSDVWADRARVKFAIKIRDQFLRDGVSKAHLRKVFKELDTDGSGTMSIREFLICRVYPQSADVQTRSDAPLEALGP